MKKITKAMELVATSRIAKAQARVAASLPYSSAITSCSPRWPATPTSTTRCCRRGRRCGGPACLVITSDRGLCGGYKRQRYPDAEQLISRLRDEGKQVFLYVVGRKGVAYYRFPFASDRGCSWTGFSEQPTYRRRARESARTLIVRHRCRSGRWWTVSRADPGHGAADGKLGVDELHIVQYAVSAR
jgi:F-type H+-transporting ATPase subunit gamma